MDRSKADVDLVLNVDEKMCALSLDSKPFGRRAEHSDLLLVLQTEKDVCTNRQALIANDAVMHRSKAGGDRVLSADRKMCASSRDAKPFDCNVHMGHEAPA